MGPSGTTPAAMAVLRGQVVQPKIVLRAAKLKPVAGAGWPAPG